MGKDRERIALAGIVHAEHDDGADLAPELARIGALLQLDRVRMLWASPKVAMRSLRVDCASSSVSPPSSSGCA